MNKKKGNKVSNQLLNELKNNVETSIDNKRVIVVTINQRMKNIKVSRYRLSKITKISESTISRFFNFETDITLFNFLKICNALDINPYLIAKEDDSKELQEINLLDINYFKRTYYNQ